MRNMAFSMTTDQVRKGTKTVTRRRGWANLKPGQHFCAIVKGMGLKKGEKVERLAILRCTGNRLERLNKIADEEGGPAKEGFPEMTAEQFIAFFVKTHPKCHPFHWVNRIEFEYVKFLP